MTNLTHDQIIAYGLKHPDPTVRDLAERFLMYRKASLMFVDQCISKSAVGPFHNQLDYDVRKPNVNHL